MVLFAQFIPLLIAAIKGFSSQQQAGAAKSEKTKAAAQGSLTAAIEGNTGAQQTEQDPLETLDPNALFQDAQDEFNSSFLG